MEDEPNHDSILTLFDLYWFHRQILLHPPPPPPPPPPPSPPPDVANPEEAESNGSRSRHRRSLSDEGDRFGSLRIRTPKLQTILSGKEAPAEDSSSAASSAAAGDGDGAGELRIRRWRRRRRGGKSSRSLTDLEFEELKGFMDLGFTFSDADAKADPRLVEIVPGLRRRESSAVKEEDGGELGEPVVRPYLSEAWDARREEEEERRYLLRNWRIPVGGEGQDLKEHLRVWAHTVASTVR
ncbi:uncharacterized protein [Typha latifolia]|uniref:uncharacterized protein n=1 Tax=Typha latifolia TaxID=4733 RepID=UPI003C2F7676